jgi:hypothetical protein
MGIDRSNQSSRLARAASLTVALACIATPGALAGSVAAAGAAATPSATSARRAPAVLVKTYKLVPKVQRTVRSTGYATYVFKAPPGRRIVSARASIVGAQRHAVAIRGRAITGQLTSYTVSLVFPGEQGNPGKLVVRLATIA